MVVRMQVFILSGNFSAGRAAKFFAIFYFRADRDEPIRPGKEPVGLAVCLNTKQSTIITDICCRHDGRAYARTLCPAVRVTTNLFSWPRPPTWAEARFAS